MAEASPRLDPAKFRDPDITLTRRPSGPCGLAEDYAMALESGLWPSCDVLPAAELKARARPIEPCQVLWQTHPV